MLTDRGAGNEIIDAAKALAPLVRQPGWRSYTVVMEPGDMTRYEIVLSERVDPYGHRGEGVVVTVLSPGARAFVWDPGYTAADYVAEKLHCNARTAEVVGAFLSLLAAQMHRIEPLR